MNLAELYAELEADRAWREDEVRDLQNRGAKMQNESHQKRFRRALVLLLYAHYEGYCKFALTLYANAVNQTGILCGRANYAVAAASLHDIFRDLRNPEKKSGIFRHALPDDSALHRFAREHEFIERASEVDKLPVKIPDDAIDMESNLTPIVLKKNLYRLGLPYDKFDSLRDEINKLLGVRNAISHGSLKDGIEEELYKRLRSATASIMTRITTDLMKSLRESAYERT